MHSPVATAALMPKERDMLLAQPDQSAKKFLTSLDRLSEAQWTFKVMPLSQPSAPEL